MVTISRQFIANDGATVTAEVDKHERWDPGQPLVSPSPEEQAAVAAALQAFDEGRLDDVRVLLGPFEQDCLHPATLLTLGRVHAVEGKFDTAEILLKEAEQRFPWEPQVWKALSILHRLQGRSLEELAYRRKLVFLVPKPAPGAYLAFAQASARAYSKIPDMPLGELQFAVKKLTAGPIADEATRRERVEVAEQLYSIRPLVHEAVNQYLAASPVPDGQRHVSVGWSPLLQWCTRNDLPCHRLDDQGRPGRRPTLAQLQRVAVMPHFQWIPVLDEEKIAIDGFMTRRARLRTELPESPLLMNRVAHRAELRMPRDLPVVEQPALLIGGMPQYYHHTIEHLGSLAVAEMLDAPPDLPIVVNDDLAPFQRELFNLLGISEHRLLRLSADAPVRFAQLWVPSRAVDAGRWIDPLIPRWCRKRLVRSAVGPARRRVYLSRAQAGRRRIANEDAVTTLLTQMGYEIVIPERLSVAEQIALFGEVSHMIAPAGAALTNMVFAPPGAMVVAMFDRFSVAGGSDLYFDALADACGHSYSQLDCRPVGMSDADRPADADVMVDLAALEATLA